MRIKSEIWVRAYLRRCQAQGVPVVIARRGDEAAGAIFICIDRLDGTMVLYGPAPAGGGGGGEGGRWVGKVWERARRLLEGQGDLSRPREVRPPVSVIQGREN